MPRTFALCESLNYREWSGYYAVSAYETHHEHEYNAIRNAAALIDISPLYKYRVSGPDATRLVDRVITRDARRMASDKSGTRCGATSTARSSTTERCHESEEQALSLDGGRSQPAMASSERDRSGGRD